MVGIWARRAVLSGLRLRGIVSSLPVLFVSVMSCRVVLVTRQISIILNITMILVVTMMVATAASDLRPWSVLLPALYDSWPSRGHQSCLGSGVQTVLAPSAASWARRRVDTTSSPLGDL
jgi:hypothetical protein